MDDVVGSMCGVSRAISYEITSELPACRDSTDSEIARLISVWRDGVVGDGQCDVNAHLTQSSHAATSVSVFQIERRNK